MDSLKKPENNGRTPDYSSNTDRDLTSIPSLPKIGKVFRERFAQLGQKEPESPRPTVLPPIYKPTLNGKFPISNKRAAQMAKLAEKRKSSSPTSELSLDSPTTQTESTTNSSLSISPTPPTKNKFVQLPPLPPSAKNESVRQPSLDRKDPKTPP